jgi:hypothetical protein
MMHTASVYLVTQAGHLPRAPFVSAAATWASKCIAIAKVKPCVRKQGPRLVTTSQQTGAERVLRLCVQSLYEKRGTNTCDLFYSVCTL